MKQLLQKRLIIAVGAVVGLMLIALAVLWINVWSQPTKKDYQAAKTALTKLDVSYDTLTSKLSTYTSTLTIDSSAEAAKKAKAAYDSAFKSVSNKLNDLGELKAIENDSVEKAYTSFKNQIKRALAYVENYSVLRKSFVSCIDLFSVTKKSVTNKDIATTHKKASVDCLPELDILAKSNISVYANYGKDFARVVRERQDTFDDLAAKQISEKAAADAVEEIGKDLKDIFAITSELQAAREAASVTPQLKGLYRVLDDQIKQLS